MDLLTIQHEDFTMYVDCTKFNDKTPAVFFDNAEHPVWVDFKKHVTKTLFGSMLQSDNERFAFGYEVLSTKLNYHEHWKKIIEDIEQEYRMLSFIDTTFENLSDLLYG